MEILVARQPIFDRYEQLYGYDLVLRRGSSGATAATAFPEQLVANAFLGIGINHVAAGRVALVTIDRNMLLSGAARLLPTSRAVLHLAENPGSDPELIDACAMLKAGGYQFSLSCDRPGEMPDELLSLASIVKVDIQAMDRAALSDLVAWLRGFQVRLLAVNVGHRMARGICTNLGFTLFAGDQLSAQENLIRRDLPIEHMSTFRLLKAIRDPRSTDREIEDILRRDIALSYKLLRMVDSAATGGHGIWSIGHALRVLERDQIGRWLELLLVTDGSRDSTRSELMHSSLVRARMCELLADASGVPRAGGPLFLIGMLSMLDQLLETPMDRLTCSIKLADEARVALLARGGYYGAVLGLVEAYQEGHRDRVAPFARSIGVSTRGLQPIYADALAWARGHQGSVPSARAARRSAGVKISR